MTTHRQRIADRARNPVVAGGKVAGLPASVPEYRPFPLRCLPEKVQDFAKTVSEATNADLAFVALPLLSVLGAAIGTTRCVIPKKLWKVFPTIWAVTVGRSTSGKSPPLLLIGEAVQQIEDELDEENRLRTEQYAADLAAYEAKRDDPEAAKPVKRSDLRFRLSDLTLEALAPILEANARGVWLCSDEVAGWLGSFARYKGKSGDTDRPRWLSLFDSGGMVIDRKSGDRRTIKVRNTLVNVAGGIQPDVLKGLMNEENVASGLFARMLIAYPAERPSRWSETEVDEDLVEGLAKLLRDLRRLDHGIHRGRPSPALNFLDPDAKRKFVEFYDANRARAFVAPDGEAAGLVKLESYAIRFAHIRHLCRFSEGGDGKPIAPDDMAMGIELAEWFAHEVGRLQAAVGEPESVRVVRRQMTFIRSKGGMTARDLQRSNGRRYPSVEMAEAFLETAVETGLGSWTESVATNGRKVRTFHPNPEGLSDAVSDAVSDAARNGSSKSLEK